MSSKYTTPAGVVVALVVIVLVGFWDWIPTRERENIPEPQNAGDVVPTDIVPDPNKEIAKTCTEESLASALKKLFSGDSTYTADLAAAELFASHAGINVSQQVLELKRLGVPREVLNYFDQAARSARYGKDCNELIREAKAAAYEIGLDVNFISDAIQQVAQTRASTSSNSGASTSINFPEAYVGPAAAAATSMGKLQDKDPNAVFFPTEAEKDLMIMDMVGLWRKERVASSLGPMIVPERYMGYSGGLEEDPNAPKNDWLILHVDRDSAVLERFGLDIQNYLGRIDAGMRCRSEFFSSRDEFKLRLESLVVACIDRALKSGKVHKMYCSSCSFQQYAGISSKVGWFELRVEMQCYK